MERKINKNTSGLFSGIIAILLFIVGTICNIIFRDTIYTSGQLIDAFAANDIVNIIIAGAAMVVLIFFIVIRQNAVKPMHMIIPGMLLFILYNSIAYLISIQALFSVILNAIIILTSLAAFVLLFAANPATGQQISSRKAGIVLAVILAIFGLLFVGRAAGNIIEKLTGNIEMSTSDLAVNIADLLICSFWIISALLIFIGNRRAVFSLFSCYLQGVLLFWGLFIFLLLRPILSGYRELNPEDIAVIGGMAVIFTVPFVLFIRIRNRH